MIKHTITLKLFIFTFILAAIAGCSSGSQDTPDLLKDQHGNLLLLFNEAGPIVMESLSLPDLTETVIFQFPDGSYVSNAEYSPDYSEILIGYSPPSNVYDFPANTQGIFVLPADGSTEPQPVLVPEIKEDNLFHPTWSPDGEYIYYTRSNVSFVEGSFKTTLQIERMNYASRDIEIILENGYFPKISPDGSSLIYIAVIGDEDAGLYITPLDQIDPRPVVQEAGFEIIDAPTFSPDGQTIIFSAPSEEDEHDTQRNWLDKLTGVLVAHAHGDLSDWWQVQIDDGTPQHLTHSGFSLLSGHFSADGDVIISIHSQGLFVMHHDGSELTDIELDNEAVPFGSIDWAP